MRRQGMWWRSFSRCQHLIEKACALLSPSRRTCSKTLPAVEFLGLEEKARYSESDLESAIVTHIEHFLLELRLTTPSL